jgi:hypothetical protein
VHFEVIEVIDIVNDHTITGISHLKMSPHSLHPGFGHLLTLISAIFEHNSTSLIESCNELDNHVLIAQQAGEIHLKLVEVDG